MSGKNINKRRSFAKKQSRLMRGGNPNPKRCADLIQPLSGYPSTPGENSDAAKKADEFMKECVFGEENASGEEHTGKYLTKASGEEYTVEYLTGTSDETTGPEYTYMENDTTRSMTFIRRPFVHKYDFEDSFKSVVESIPSGLDFMLDIEKNENAIC
jgi:hypothetical protein